MSRTLLVVIIIAAIGAGIYYFAVQPEPTPVEQTQAATEEASEAVSETANAITEETNEAASSIAEQATEAADQAGQAATDLVNQAGEDVAALANQGQDLLNSWIEEGALTLENFDYDTIVASIQESDMAQGMKTQAIQILDDIQASPELIAAKIQELRELLAGQ